MMGLLKRFVPVWVYWAAGAGVLAFVVAFGSYMYLKGGWANDVKWVRAVLGWERKQTEINRQFDEITVKRNGTLFDQLRENDEKWKKQPQ
ncbi:MAG: hypothetical protein RIC14_00025 [Filomicrobium sp.]